MINKTDKRNEQGASLIPILIILAIVLGVGYFLTGGELPKVGSDQTEVRRLEGFPTVAYTRDIVEKQRVVIKSEEELNEFLNTIDSSGQLVLLEDIDFEKEWLLGAATETLETNGYGMKIRKLYIDEEDSSILASVRETRPGENCEVDTQPNVAVDLVAVKHTDWEIAFERVTKIEDCN